MYSLELSVKVLVYRYCDNTFCKISTLPDVEHLGVAACPWRHYLWSMAVTMMMMMMNGSMRPIYEGNERDAGSGQAAEARWTATSRGAGPIGSITGVPRRASPARHAPAQSPNPAAHLMGNVKHVFVRWAPARRALSIIDVIFSNSIIITSMKCDDASWQLVIWFPSLRSDRQSCIHVAPKLRSGNCSGPKLQREKENDTWKCCIISPTTVVFAFFSVFVFPEIDNAQSRKWSRPIRVDFTPIQIFLFFKRPNFQIPG